MPQLPSLLPAICLALALLAAALACQQPQPTPSPTLPPTAAPLAPTATPTPTPTPTPLPTKALPQDVIITREIIRELPGPDPTPTPTPIPLLDTDPIIFADLNWSSTLLQTRIAQYIVEIGYRYPTDVWLGSIGHLLQTMR